GAGPGRSGAGGAAERRGGDWQVTPGAGAARASRSRAAYSPRGALFVLCAAESLASFHLAAASPAALAPPRWSSGEATHTGGDAGRVRFSATRGGTAVGGAVVTAAPRALFFAHPDTPAAAAEDSGDLAGLAPGRGNAAAGTIHRRRPALDRSVD